VASLKTQTQPSMTTALDFVNAASFPSTEILSQILIIQALANQSLDALTNELTARLQYNGGLGDLVDYDRTIYRYRPNTRSPCDDCNHRHIN
jgi:hypothetical protein